MYLHAYTHRHIRPAVAYGIQWLTQEPHAPWPNFDSGATATTCHCARTAFQKACYMAGRVDRLLPDVALPHLNFEPLRGGRLDGHRLPPCRLPAPLGACLLPDVNLPPLNFEPQVDGHRLPPWRCPLPALPAPCAATLSASRLLVARIQKLCSSFDSRKEAGPRLPPCLTLEPLGLDGSWLTGDRFPFGPCPAYCPAILSYSQLLVAGIQKLNPSFA